MVKLARKFKKSGFGRYMKKAHKARVSSSKDTYAIDQRLSLTYKRHFFDDVFQGLDHTDQNALAGHTILVTAFGAKMAISGDYILNLSRGTPYQMLILDALRNRHVNSSLTASQGTSTRAYVHLYAFAVEFENNENFTFQPIGLVSNNRGGMDTLIPKRGATGVSRVYVRLAPDSGTTDTYSWPDNLVFGNSRYYRVRLYYMAVEGGNIS